MSVTYTGTYSTVEEGLRNLIIDEFKGVYIGRQFKKVRSNEAVRIYLEDSEPLESPTDTDKREYHVLIRHYWNMALGHDRHEKLRDRTDRLKELLMENKYLANSWYDMLVGIVYDVIDDEEDVEAIKTDFNLTIFKCTNI